MKKKPAKRRLSKAKGKRLSQAELKKITGGVAYSMRVFNDSQQSARKAVYQLDPMADRDRG